MKELYNFENIKKDKLTTALGLLIIIASVVSVFTLPEVTWSDAVIGALFGLSLFPLKINKDKKGAFIIALVVLFGAVLGLPSCTTFQKCQNKFGNMGDTVYVKSKVIIHDTVTVISEGDTAIGRVQLDSLLMMSNQDTIYITSKKGKANAKLYKDKNNNYLNAFIECLSDTVVKTTVKEVEVKVPCPPPVVFKPEAKKGWQKFKQDYKDLAAIGFPILLFSILVILIKRR